MTITTIMIEDAIDALGKEFDSHDVIHKLAHVNQRAYISDLHSIENETPFHTLHTSLGIQIKKICLARGFTNGNASRSKDFFGQQSKCLSWIK